MLNKLRNLAIVMAIFVSVAAAQAYRITWLSIPIGDIVYAEPCVDITIHVTPRGIHYHFWYLYEEEWFYVTLGSDEYEWIYIEEILEW